ncbi:hypothetical protein H4W81_002518 [Nonomuraea africana]|uniref:Uncharacterized protein n=1 Tax=Nonomuraea africana TaxID=46171 RepID=A0ABR9KCK4_9ACTN|nr:hypothetical protein [Nonomuraea africana]
MNNVNDMHTVDDDLIVIFLMTGIRFLTEHAA